MGRAAWPILRGIAEGLAYAHRKGIVHSDLKPGNVFLLDDNTPKILDFGIARAIPVAGASMAFPDVFDAGILGAYTESYATAEMIDGKDPHPSDDVYALGLIAYELITGTHPYRRHGAVKARELGLTPEQPKGLSRREWRVLQSSLAFERTQRPRDAADFLKRLTGITSFQQWLIGVTVLLAMASGFFWYRSYVAEGPVTPFAQLPTETQQQFTVYMQEGDQLWQFYEKYHNLLALQEAVEQYAAAYQLHPRNRDSTRALIKTADAILNETKSNPEQQRKFAQMLAARSEFLSKYQPVMSATQ
jgi:serine/threonine protein kinase